MTQATASDHASRTIRQRGPAIALTPRSMSRLCVKYEGDDLLGPSPASRVWLGIALF